MDKIKRFLADDSFFYGLLIILVAVTSYGLGRHSVTLMAETKAESQVTLVREATETPPATTAAAVPEAAAAANQEINPEVVPSANTQLVGSKNGTKYHLPTCPGAKQIKEGNKVYFDSVEAARAAGYTPAGNCKGLE